MSFFCIFIFALGFAASSSEHAKLRFTPQKILEAVASHTHATLDPLLPLPVIHLESETNLADFQRAVLPQWGAAPEKFSNAYILDKADIYLIDDISYYRRLHRTMDDSLAHELAHYIQEKYLGYDLKNDFSAEEHAIGVQTWFRETYMADILQPLGRRRPWPFANAKLRPQLNDLTGRPEF